MAQGKIERRQGACSACEREFADGERHASTLVTDEEGGLGRRDLCDRCWREAGSPGAPVPEGESREAVDGVFWWFTRHQVVQKQSVQLDLASLERLFIELEGREELKVRELRYVLCLLLMRKRRVKLERVLRNGEEESFIVRRPKEDTRYSVHVFDFDVERVTEIRAELQAIFDGADGEEGVSLAHLTDATADVGLEPEAEPLEDGADRADGPAEGISEEPDGGPLGSPVEGGGAEVQSGLEGEAGSADSAGPEDPDGVQWEEVPALPESELES